MKKIALINDLSGFGKCSLTAAISVVSVMGIHAVPLPTAVLSAQTGFQSFYCDDYTDRMDIFTEEWKKMNVHFDGIHSGYLAGSEQIKKVMHLLDAFQTKDTVYLADPVMGDNGRQFKAFSKELLDGMKQLCARASITTPNLTELCLLTGTDYETLTAFSKDDDYLARILDIAKKLLQTMQSNTCSLVTGIIRQSQEGAFMGNMAVTEDHSFYHETPYIPQSFSGTGDLFAAVICASLVNGLTVEEAAKKATFFLKPAIEDAVAEHVESNHGVDFEKYLGRLIDIK
ncbi:MAG: pyridoxamine kinase [Lachnospiraceae bacterium]|nr:pyridoxamine kinase [Lachnospiraceae bacterium]